MKKHTSYRGQKIDMEMLKFQNQHSVALGNLNMNARGDIIGKGGTVLKSREELLADQERLMQTPDIMPEHQSHSIAPSLDGFDDFDDSQFSVPDFEPVQEPFSSPEEDEAPKRTPKRAKTKDQE